MNIPEQIRAKLAVLEPSVLDLRDDSAKHVGHAGAATGGGHYCLQIVSERFVGLNSVARHRLVYEILGEMMRHEIHALAIEARTPGEANS
ncbi:BolA family protein [Chitinimonas sp. BJB300]|uniref:BolA family protein n=1 Tax=Chitinimonas sp. BJB300 TaxID=1559339 RepID=UPI000C0DCA20|nr:BolA family protein [Chitinimonas sp. BJB300]PHV12408.1 BolA family transcriptional regulator [Chitinimonas sp. BJB300]TSJ89006.1 BolA family transcriptional regulator [Chitinimonas sp. BJB300]